MKVRSLYLGIVLGALILAMPYLRAQDGLAGALSRHEATRNLLHAEFEQRLVATDFDNDKRPDGAVLLDAGQIRGQETFRIELHLTAGNDSSLNFESNEPMLGVSALDVNQDGSPDIVVEQAFTHRRLHVWLNDGHGSFRAARVEDFPSTGRDGPYKFELPSPGPDYPSLYFASKLGSDHAMVEFSAACFISLDSNCKIRPNASAIHARVKAPNPSRGPPSFLSL